jgi:hypothetical protein
MISLRKLVAPCISIFAATVYKLEIARVFAPGGGGNSHFAPGTVIRIRG